MQAINMISNLFKMIYNKYSIKIKEKGEKNVFQIYTPKSGNYASSPHFWANSQKLESLMMHFLKTIKK